MQRAVDKLDSRIAMLRAQRARAEKESLPMAVMEISAKRAAPAEQRVRLVTDENDPPPGYW
jgi:hypothetical protein